MGRMTFVIEYPDGQEPPVDAGMTFGTGKVVAASFQDSFAAHQRTEDKLEHAVQALDSIATYEAGEMVRRAQVALDEIKRMDA